MQTLFLIALGVAFSGAAAMLCLRRGLSGGTAVAAVIAAAVVGAAYVVATEMILSGLPTDRRYFAMDIPRFAFQGGFVGMIIGLAVVFARCVRDLSEPRQRW